MSSSWGKSWLSSWLNSWGTVTQQGHSGWFRLWLIKLQEKANADREKEKTVGVAAKAATPAERQGSISVPAMVQKRVKQGMGRTISRRRISERASTDSETHEYVLPAKVTEQPHYIIPDFSVTIYQKMRDAANQEQFKQHRRRREEEALILLLAA